MKGNAFFRKLNVLIALGGVAAALIFYGCGNLFSSANDAPANFAQPKEGYGIVSGNLPSSNSANARTAMPGGIPTPTSYKVFARNGSQKIDANVDNVAKTFSIALPFGTWDVTANGLDAGGRIIFTQTKGVTLDASNPNESLDFKLGYSTNPDDGDGEIALSVSFPPKDPTSNPPSAITGIEYILSKGEEKIIRNVGSEDLTSGNFQIEHTTDNLGAWNLTIRFYGDFSNLVYRIDQTVNVYANLTTDTFEGSAPYISGGKIVLKQALLEDFQNTTLYVNATSGRDTNTGTQFDPLQTFNRAVELVNNSSRSADTEFRIFLQTDVADGATLALNVGKKLTVASAGNTAHTITSLGRTFTVENGSDLTVQSVKFEKLRFEVSGTFTMNGGEISGNTADNDGGGVSVYESGEFTMTGGTISGNTSTKRGGGVCVMGGTLTMTGGTIGGNIADNNGGGVYVDGGTFTMKNGTISNNKSTDNSGGGVYVDCNDAKPGTFTMENGTIKDNAANGSGGGVYVNGNTSVAGIFMMQNGTIDKNTANTDGGGVCVYNGNFTMENGTISGNKATKGKGAYVYPGCTFAMSGAAKFDENDDIYLTANATIQVAGSPSKEKVATITPSNYAAGRQVLSAGTGITITKEICNQFTVTPESESNGTEWTIAPSGNTGVLSTKMDAYYVRGVGGCYDNATAGEPWYGAATADDDNNSGSRLSPFATIQKAIDTVIDQNDGSSKYMIVVDGTLDGTTAALIGENGMADFSKFDQNDLTLTLTIKALSDPATLNAGARFDNDSIGIKKRVIYASTSGKLNLTLENLKIMGGSALGADGDKNNYFNSGGGGIYFKSPGGTLTMKKCTVKENHAGTVGGGIYNYNTLIMEDCEINSNTSKWGDGNKGGGGGIYNMGVGILTMKNCTVSGNRVPTYSNGGGIYNASMLTMEGGEISVNTAQYGGGVCLGVSSGKFTMKGDAKIIGNTATYNGGGVYVDGSNSTFTMEGGTIGGNNANEDGGGVCMNIDVSPANFLMTGGEISGNHANNGNGGGVSIKKNGIFTLESGGTISGNTARYGGGVQISDGGMFEMTGGTIGGEKGGNTATGNGSSGGGGVHIYKGMFTMSGGKISKNEATGTTEDSGGGGIYIVSGNTFTMTGGTISGNISNVVNNSDIKSKGGGIYNNGTLVIENAEISGNTAASGAGIFSVGGTIKLESGAKVSNNIDGGGICATNSTTLTMKAKAEVNYNTSQAESGGILVNSGSNFTMTGGTISHNTTTSKGGGVYIGMGGTFTMNGGTIGDNKAVNGGGVYINAGSGGLGTFTMGGGKITNNTANSNGGGVYVGAGSMFTREDRWITDNNPDNIYEQP